MPCRSHAWGSGPPPGAEERIFTGSPDHLGGLALAGAKRGVVRDEPCGHMACDRPRRLQRHAVHGARMVVEAALRIS